MEILMLKEKFKFIKKKMQTGIIILILLSLLYYCKQKGSKKYKF